MNSPFKFLRRVRIHGGECGAVARALHHEVKGLSLYQADSGKALESTFIERKQMSTKTTLKRIALAAVSALGFGLLNIVTVAPASANGAITPTAVTVGTIPSAAIGSSINIPVSITAPMDNTIDTFTVTVKVTSAPTGSALASVAGAGTAAAGTGAGASFITGVYASGSSTMAKLSLAELSNSATLQIGTATQKNDLTPSVSALFTATNWVSGVTKGSIYVVFQPDKAGSYTFLVSTATGAPTVATAAYTAGDANTSFTVTTAVAPTTVTLAAVTGATSTGTANDVGRLMKATLNTGAALGETETIALTTNDTTNATLAIVTSQTAGTTGSYATTQTLTNAHFVNGVAYFKLLDEKATANTVVVTATGSGTLSSSITATVSSTTVLLAQGASITVNNGVDAVRPGSGHVGGTAGATFTDTASTSATSHTYGLTSTTTTAAVTRMTVTDTDGAITGIPGVTYETTVSTAVTTGLGTVSFTATLADTESFTATIHSSTATASITVTGATPVVSTCTAEPAATIYATHGASVVATALCKDQFGAAVANSPITVAVTGRNATTASTSLATDATGRVSYTLADAGTAATVLTQSVITFTSALATDPTVTVNYGVDRVSAVALSTPTSLDTAASGVTYSDINASSTAGASATLVTITATVTDVNGAVLVGVPVTFSTADAGAAVLSTKVTVYTGTDGKAASSVYGWTAGTKTFTATAGAVSKTGTVSFRQGGATGTFSTTEARTMTIARSGNAITVKVSDRFGNPVAGVPLWGTRTGTGTFGGGSNTNGQTTGEDGTAEFLFNGGASGDSVVTITAGSATAAPLPCYAQTGNAAGMNVCSTATTQTAYTATTVGTTTTAETGVGASFAPAGTPSVSITVPADTAAADSINAATDAAAEAIDAANAATDAANLAAEAADAATVAAEEARDAADAATAAVEELATQVATLMAALKAQITTLANTVAKIAKKVKA